MRTVQPVCRGLKLKGNAADDRESRVLGGCKATPTRPSKETEVGGRRVCNNNERRSEQRRFQVLSMHRGTRINGDRDEKMNARKPNLEDGDKRAKRRQNHQSHRARDTPRDIKHRVERSTRPISAQINMEPGTSTSPSRDSVFDHSPYLGRIEMKLWNPIGYGVQELMQ